MYLYKHACTNCLFLHPNVGLNCRQSGLKGLGKLLIGWRARRLEFMANQLQKIFWQIMSTGNVSLKTHILKDWELTGLMWGMLWTCVPFMEGKTVNSLLFSLTIIITHLFQMNLISHSNLFQLGGISNSFLICLSRCNWCLEVFVFYIFYCSVPTCFLCWKTINIWEILKSALTNEFSNKT